MPAEISAITIEEICEHLEGLFYKARLKFLRSAGLQPTIFFEEDEDYDVGQWLRSHFELDLSQRSELRKVLSLFENIMFDLETGDYHENVRAPQKLKRLKSFIERDGFIYRKGVITDPSRPAESEHLEQIAREMNLVQIEKQVERMLDSLEDDPSLAIGTAKELLETVGKTILDELQIAYETGWTLTQLLAETRKALKLTRKDIPERTKGNEAILKILGCLGTVVDSMAHLRNDYGTGHGRSGKEKDSLQARHARLACGASSIVSVFLLERHQTLLRGK